MSAPDQSARIEVAAPPMATNDWTTLTLRLIRWDVFQAWRRVMAKVLLGILVGLFVLEVLGYTLVYAFAQANASEGGGQISGALRDQLTFPHSVAMALEYTALLGVILLCILAGALVGGEYGFGTLRLALSRGLGRGQVLLAKVGALVALAVLVAGGMLLLGTLLGLTLGPALGGIPQAMPLDGFFQLLAYGGAVALRLVVYSLIALCFATLGRSVAAGVGGVLGFVVVEVVVLPILQVAIAAQRFAQVVTNGRPAAPSQLTQTLTVVLNAFPKTNADALASAAREGPLALQPPADTSQIQSLIIAPPPGWQALLVLLLWCAILIGASYLLVRGRDVTD